MLIQARFIVNLKKSDLNLTQVLVYIRARFRTVLGRLYLLEEWIDRLLALVRSFSRVGQYKPVFLYLTLLGLMASTLQMEYAHLHIVPSVVPSVLFELHNPWAAEPNPCHCGSGPSASVMVG